jgi:hypothetical protein
VVVEVRGGGAATVTVVVKFRGSSTRIAVGDGDGDADTAGRVDVGNASAEVPASAQPAAPASNSATPTTMAGRWVLMVLLLESRDRGHAGPRSRMHGITG